MFYRTSTETVARQLGLSGWVRNLDDGRVELIACGEDIKLRELEQWLWRGPSHARVQQVQVVECPMQNFSGFSVRG